MNIHHLTGVLLLSAMLTACGSSSSGGASSASSLASSQAASSSAPASSAAASSEVAESSASSSSVPSGTAAFVCPETGLYFCDDFQDGEFASTWDAVIDGYGLSSPGTFDILDEGEAGKSLRFTAGTRGGELYQGELILVKEEAFTGVPADYFVEYRIRPRANGNTGNKFLFAMGRYQGPLQWYFGGLNMQDTTSSTQVETGHAADGNISRPVQVKKPLELGTMGGTDGIWYTVRFDMVGSEVTVYLDGEEVGSYTDGSGLYSEPGRVGFFTYNRSFEVDYVKVGDPANKPAQLTIDPPGLSWTAEAEADDYVVTVTAVQSNGDPDSFSVESSNPSVVGVSVDGNSVNLSPLSEGTAAITFTSGSDTNLKRTINATITPAFSQPVAIYNLTDRTVPVVAETDTLRDTRLRLTFDSAPTLGDAGSIRLYKVSDNSVADNISITGETDSLPALDRSRNLNTEQVWVEGNTVVIAPHFGVLEPGTEYYVAIADGVINGTLNGETFVGMGENAGWTFTTSAVTPSGSDVTVATTGVADFRTVQGALSYIMANVPQNDPATITIKSGTYQEPLYLRNKNNLTITGESGNRDDVVIQYRNNNGINPGTSERALFLVEGSDMLTLENLTLLNTTLIGQGGQAETIYFNSSNRLIVKNAAFISEQDTLLLKGYTWFYQSLVAGNVDFIWGGNHVSLFEECEIRTIGRSSGSGGYILQARTVNATDKGFVFLNSELTRGPGPTGTTIPDNSIPLARSGGSAAYYDNIVFVNTKMDSHITSAGWHISPLPNPNPATATSGWREYNSMDMLGEPLNTSGRWSGAYPLTEQEYEAEFSTRAQIFSAYGNGAGWDPQP